MKRGQGMVLVLVVAGLFVGAWLLGLFSKSGKYDNPDCWVVSTRHTDSNPFGMELFDSVMSASLPKGYRYRRMTVEEACRTDSAGPVTLMYVTSFVLFNQDETRMLRDFVVRGNRLLVVTDNQDYDDHLLDKSYDIGRRLQVDFGNMGEFDFSDFKEALDKDSLDSIRWVADNRVFRFPYPLLTRCLFSGSSANKVLATVEADVEDPEDSTVTHMRVPMLLQRRVGRGEVMLATGTFFFTNYGVLHPGLSPYIGRVMNLAADKPVVRFSKSYTPIDNLDGMRTESPLKFLLSNRPTRWALGLALAAIMLFFVFRARRRQRVIPVMPLPENKSVELAQVLGTIYYRRGDHRDLLNKKFRFFAYALRKRLFIDITDPEADEQSVATLSSVTGRPAQELKTQLQTIRSALKSADDEQLDPKQLEQYIDFMNEIS